MFVFFSSWKTVFKHSWQLLDTSRYLAYLSSSSIAFYRNLNTSRQLGGLIEKVSVPSIAPQQLPWSIELVLLWTPLDTCSIAESVEAFKAQPLSTPIYLSRFTEPLNIHSAWSVLHFPRSLSIALNRFTSQIHFSHSKLHSQKIFSLDQVFPHLVRVLIFLFQAFSSFIT